MATDAHADAAEQRNIRALCKVRLGLEVTPGQADIIRRIVYGESKRLVICCTTRYGKSLAVGAAVVLWLGWHPNKRCAVIAPTMRQTAIIREYFLNFLAEDKHGTGRFIDWEAKEDADKLRKELNRERYLFTNGASISFFSAEGEGKRLMGWGGDLIIEDEGVLIPDEVYRTKISRMLGDHPGAQLIEIGNPWSMDSHFYEHWTNPSWDKIHIGWEQAVKEGRINPLFLQEQRGELTPMEFQILYESVFPDESEDSVFNFQHILAAAERTLDFEAADTIIGCDVADKGLDETVMWKVQTNGEKFRVLKLYHENKSELAQVAHKLLAFAEEPPRATIINIDSIGVGAGVLSMVKELCANKKFAVNGCHNGMSARNKDRFLNAKAEQIFFLKTLFAEGRIAIPKHEKLFRDLRGTKWVYSQGQKIKINDPQKSPDYSDALEYATWYRPMAVYGL